MTGRGLRRGLVVAQYISSMSATGSTRSRIGIVESLSGPLVSIGAVLLAFLCGALMIVAEIR